METKDRQGSNNTASVPCMVRRASGYVAPALHVIMHCALLDLDDLSQGRLQIHGRSSVVHSEFNSFFFGHDSMGLSISLAFSLVSYVRLKLPKSCGP